MADPLHLVLKQAIDASRKALADLDADQVPADLRRVYTSGGGRLPPPLVEALLSGVDRYEWLRAKALEVWEDADPGEGGRAGAAAGFLVREGQWARVLARAVADEADEAGAARYQAVLHRLADAEGMVELQKSRNEAERRSMIDELTRVRQERDVARSANKESAASESRERERMEARAAEDRRTAAALAAELAEALRRLEAAGEAVRDERRARAAAEHMLTELDSKTGWWADDPIEMAVRLDDMAMMQRPAAPGLAADRAITTDDADVALPSTINPDGAGAIDWLLARPGPTTVFVDGYNVGYRMTGTPEDPAGARERLLPVLGRLTRLASGPLTVVVVFDGVADLDGGDSGGGRVKVVFTTDTTADEEIAEAACAAAQPVVVISDDREVRDSVEACGGCGLWSAALVAWAARRR